MSDIDLKTALAALSVLNGKHILQKIEKEGLGFILNFRLKHTHGTILFQEYNVTGCESIETDKLIYLGSQFYKHQFEIINATEGNVFQIIGDSFGAFWEGDINKESIINLIHSLSLSFSIINDRYQSLNSTFRVKGIVTYIDCGDFVLTKIGSPGRYNYVPYGNLISRGMSFVPQLRAYPNILFTGEGFLSEYGFHKGREVIVRFGNSEYKAIEISDNIPGAKK
jgi:hypothetical protein